MQAFSSLKGAGAITDKEGEAATKAIATISNRNQSTESYMKGLNDLKTIIERGKVRAGEKIGAAQPQQSQKLSGDALVNFYLNGGK